MRIKKLTFENTETGWKIENFEFGKLSLLVGASGVGKTQILKVIMGLKGIANGTYKGGWIWTVEFEENGDVYHWEGHFSDMNHHCTMVEDCPELGTIVIVESEKIAKNNEIIVSRTQDEILFNGYKTPKLNSQISAIALLKEEDSIKPIYQAWNSISIMDLKYDTSKGLTEKNANSLNNIEKIKSVNISLMEKLYLLNEYKLDTFNEIEQTFKSIFPTIEKIGFLFKLTDNDNIDNYFGIKEYGIEDWIQKSNISSGMLRTLMQIVMIKLADDGDVILIDEFENSLGVNCIDDVADLVLHPDANVQFIITSHHPYIINNIPFKNWKIVTRKGSTVSVHRPEELNIGTHSKHEAFMQLIQTDAYKKGIL